MHRFILSLLTALPFILGVRGAVAAGHNVLLSRDRTEPVVAIDPSDPSLIVAGGNTNYIPGPDGVAPNPYFTSHDGGRTFSSGSLPLPAPYITAADSSVAIAQDSTVFFSYLAESATYCWSGPGAVLLAHSVDRGVSFRGPVVVDSNSADDRPTMAVARVPGKASHLFVAWTRSYPNRNEIWFARSVDGGAGFSPATMLYSSSFTNFGAQPVVGPNGQIAVFWQTHSNVAAGAVGPAQVLLANSNDDGLHFGPVHGAGKGFQNLPELTQPESLRNLTTFASVAAPSGTLYLAYAAVRHRHPDGSVDADIWLTRSRDHGVTWSSPRRVNDDRRGDRFMPSLSVLSDGTLGVAFYDRRSSPGELDVYAVRASFTGRFRATPNVRVNSSPSPVADVSYFKEADSCFPTGRFFGDYIGTAAEGTALGVVWADTQLQQKDESDLWFARVSLPALADAQQGKVLHSPSHQSLLSRGWHKLTAGPRSFLSSFGGLLGHVGLGGLSGAQVFVVLLLFLLPGLAVATALMSMRTSRGW